MTTSEFFLSQWRWYPGALIACVGMVIAYRIAWRKTRSKPRSPWLFAAGVAVFLLTLFSPLDALADGYLFSAHMAQHLLLLLVVPALFLMALPPGNFSITGKAIERFGGIKIVSSWLAGVGAMWLWHVPSLCDAAAGSHAVKAFQTISLLVLGAMFWLPVLSPDVRLRVSPLAGVLYLFTACVGCTLLGIIITFAPVSVCPLYAHPMDHAGLLPMIRGQWGMTPSVDQQVGGLLMWVPACLIYLCGIVGLLGKWFAAVESANVPSDSYSVDLDHPAAKPKSSHA